MHILQTAVKKIELGLRICAKLLLFTPLLLAMVLVNFTVDRSGLFHSEEFETRVAQALLDGRDLTGYDQLNERMVYEEMAKVMETPFDTLALGSSRVLQLRGETVGGSFMNCGMSNADYRDLMAVFYLFDRADMLPKNLIFCVDPGLFYDNEAMLNPLADRTTSVLFEEFLTLKLGVPTDYVPQKKDDNARLKALVSPTYLQGNLKTLYSGKKKEIAEPETVTENLDAQPVNVKLADGSVLYSLDYRKTTGEKLASRIHTDAYSLQRLDGYRELSPRLVELYEKFFSYVRQRGVNLIFLLPPYHPTSYAYASQFKNQMPGFFQMEVWCREYASQNGVALYGSYNPYVGPGFFDEDFFDGLHPTPEALAKIFPGVRKAEQAIAEGSPTSPALYGGQTVAYKTAEYYVAQQQEITAPDTLRRLPDEPVGGSSCYILGRFNAEDEQIARYAVSRDAGVFYRYDTDVEQWVTDLRFPPE